MQTIAIALGGASVLAALAFGAVAVRRRRARQHHIPRLRPVVPRKIERAVRVAQTPLDVERLDAALRSLATGLAGRTGPLPDPVASVVDPTGIHLLLAAVCAGPPTPWEDHGDQWLLPGEEPVEADLSDVAPLPSLTAVGYGEGAHLLLDLERVGCLTLTGPATKRADLLRYIAAELALNSWSDEVDVVLAGVRREDADLIVALNPGRVRYVAAPMDAINRISRRVASAEATLGSAGVDDALAGRLADAAADTWMPTILIIADPDEAARDALHQLDGQLTHARRCGVGAVIATAGTQSVGRWNLAIGADGTIELPFPSPVTYTAAGLPLLQLQRLADLMRDARDGAEEPVPAAAEIEDWAAGTDAAGSLLPPPPTTAYQPASPASPGVWDDEADDADAQGSLLTVAIPNADGSRPPRLVTAAIRQRSRQSDPQLDDDLKAWRAASPDRPRVRILGPVTIDAPGPQPEQRQRFHAEIIVYLAQRGARGADRDQLDEALWPDREVEAATRRVAIMRARRWLGETSEGEQWLPDMGQDRAYRLRPGYLLDWHLFRRLRARGEAHGSAGAKDLRAALELVRGEPLDGADRPYSAAARNPYTWLPDSDIHPDHIVAALIDTAHQLAEMYLDTGDTGGARWAVEQAWLADPHRGYDQPWCDLMRAQHRDGHTAQLRNTFTDLMRLRDAEVPEDLAPDTYAVALEVLPDVIRAGVEAIG
jgi:DNA-binding SARP family transcriptional activator